ncbi:non-ribosomal peptide synthetase [Streptomyces albipurpureus]|uniref:Amino acid adenylation domain-containing protein n=1 Tax=Streptomyces albipurpureus TaxID=2897419 RepID=A0ABT0UMF2_9ACTN|nr:amino acid adenylation domain-containing protein [Streptomyces sp. CWNU-1]MCM2389609.1 amino acid adenylation domain-containing protein [Streptomyces sp. CWNU-1]
MTSIPTSPAQQGIWVNERLGPLGSVHHMPFAVHFEGVLNEAALTAACADLAAQHPALSRAIREEDGLPVLIPAATPQLTIRQTTAARLTAELAELSAVPFDLAIGPPARFTLLRTDRTHATLLVVAHHIAFDGASTDVFLRDLAARYAHRTGGGPAPAPSPLATATTGGEETAVGPLALAAASAHWADRPLPEAAVLLPGLLAEPSDGVGPGAAVSFDVHPQLRADLAVTAEKLGVTLFELLLAALHTLLSRYGNERPAVAVDLGTRSPETVDRIGVHVNELPVVTAPEPRLPFGEFAREVRTELRAGYPHRGVPLARAVRGLRPGVALAPVSFTYRRRIAPVEFVGLSTTIDWVLFPGTARGALRVHLVDGPDRLGVLLMYRTRLLAHDRAERIGAHLRQLLASIVAAPGAALADLSLVDEAESAPVRGPAAAPEAMGATLPSLLIGAFASHPERVAVHSGELTYTYAQLAAGARELAGRLVAVGVTPGTVVAVCAERSPEMLAAVLAVTLAGGVYLPVDPTYPSERIAFVLADAGAPVALAQRRTAERVAGQGRILLLDDLLCTAGAPATDPVVLPTVTPDDLAYLIYTSGSTGRPKGVEVPHGALAHLLLAFRGQLAATPEDSWLAVTSLSFDISALELLLPLVTGGRVVIADEAQVRDGRALTGLVERHAVTHLQATPSGWRLMLDAGLRAPGLTALSGGEALSLPLARRLRERVGRLWNVYGPTETTIWSTSAELPPAPREVSIGHPIAGTTALILASDGRPVPHGVAGELALGGAGLARGYRNRPELNADRFITHTETGARYYRTGDLARLRPDGGLDCLGRLDDQIKLRGHRIELGEVEARLQEHPAVATAAVAVRGSAEEPRGQVLAAYPVWRVGLPIPTTAELRAFLALTLPDVMVPAVFHPLPRLPLTPNGKTDRRSLPEPVHEQPTNDPASVTDQSDEPWDELTTEVAAIWCEVLGLPSIGLYDDLFDLGAHSLTITQVAARIRRRLGAEVPLQVFYDEPTVAAVSDAVTLELLSEES